MFNKELISCDFNVGRLKINEHLIHQATSKNVLLVTIVAKLIKMETEHIARDNASVKHWLMLALKKLKSCVLGLFRQFRYIQGVIYIINE